MNTIIQNILAFSAIGFALLYLAKKFVWKKAKTKKTCGTDDCGCH